MNSITNSSGSSVGLLDLAIVLMAYSIFQGRLEKMSVRVHLLEKAAIEECQIRFLRAAADHPKIRLEASLREVLPRWHQLWPKQLSPGESADLPVEFYRLIREWAQSHNLDYEWVVGHARRTLILWVLGGPALRAFDSGPDVSPPNFQSGLRLPGEGDSDYRRRQIRQFTDHFDRYLRTVQESRKRVLRNHGALDAHYRWAVERTCLGWPYEKSAKANSVAVSPQAVRQAVLPILEKVGIPKTKPKRREK